MPGDRLCRGEPALVQLAVDCCGAHLVSGVAGSTNPEA